MSIDILVVSGCLLALIPVLFLGVLALAVCMRSSQISRRENSQVYRETITWLDRVDKELEEGKWDPIKKGDNNE